MKFVLILALTSMAFATVSWDITYDDACTKQTAVISATDSADAIYGNWMADCPETIASPDADTSYGCDYFAQIYAIDINTPNTFVVKEEVVATTDGSEVLGNSIVDSVADTDCTTDSVTTGSFAATCIWTVTPTNTFWATAIVEAAGQSIADSTFTESPCTVSSSAAAWAGLSSAVLFF